MRLLHGHTGSTHPEEPLMSKEEVAGTKSFRNYYFSFAMKINRLRGDYQRGPLISLCTPASPTPSSQHPLSAPFFPVNPCFSPLTGVHCSCVTVPCGLLFL